MAAPRLRTALGALADLLFPPLCLLCDAPLAGRPVPEVCTPCRSGFPRLRPPLCAGCGAPSREARPRCRLCREWTALESARSAFAYAGCVRPWIRQIKYQGVASLALLAAEPLAGALEDLPLARGASALVPVPLHAARWRERGFNQAERLAVELGRRAALPVLDLLARRRPTRSQVGLAARERATNVRGACEVRREEAAYARGRVLVLVDDVLTTGATLEEAARALREAGAAAVAAVTLARALPGEDA